MTETEVRLAHTQGKILVARFRRIDVLVRVIEVKHYPEKVPPGCPQRFAHVESLDESFTMKMDRDFSELRVATAHDLLTAGE
jgi:hypothetical protein